MDVCNCLLVCGWRGSMVQAPYAQRSSFALFGMPGILRLKQYRMLLIFGNSTREKRQCALSCGEGCHKYQGRFESLRCFRKCAKYKGSACGKKIAKRLGKTREGNGFGMGSSAQRDKGERHHQRSSLPHSPKNAPEKGKVRAQEPSQCSD